MKKKCFCSAKKTINREIADRMRESPGYLLNMGLKFEYVKNSKN